jgi:hypothetical protein
MNRFLITLLALGLSVQSLWANAGKPLFELNQDHLIRIAKGEAVTIVDERAEMRSQIGNKKPSITLTKQKIEEASNVTIRLEGGNKVFFKHKGTGLEVQALGYQTFGEETRGRVLALEDVFMNRPYQFVFLGPDGQQRTIFVTIPAGATNAEIQALILAEIQKLYPGAQWNANGQLVLNGQVFGPGYQYFFDITQGKVPSQTLDAEALNRLIQILMAQQNAAANAQGLSEAQLRALLEALNSQNSGNATLTPEQQAQLIAYLRSLGVDYSGSTISIEQLQALLAQLNSQPGLTPSTATVDWSQLSPQQIQILLQNMGGLSGVRSTNYLLILDALRKEVARYTWSDVVDCKHFEDAKSRKKHGCDVNARAEFEVQGLKYRIQKIEILDKNDNNDEWVILHEHNGEYFLIDEKHHAFIMAELNKDKDANKEVLKALRSTKTHKYDATDYANVRKVAMKYKEQPANWSVGTASSRFVLQTTGGNTNPTLQILLQQIANQGSGSSIEDQIRLINEALAKDPQFQGRYQVRTGPNGQIQIISIDPQTQQPQQIEFVLNQSNNTNPGLDQATLEQLLGQNRAPQSPASTSVTIREAEIMKRPSGRYEVKLPILTDRGYKFVYFEIDDPNAVSADGQSIVDEATLQAFLAWAEQQREANKGQINLVRFGMKSETAPAPSSSTQDQQASDDLDSMSPEQIGQLAYDLVLKAMGMGDTVIADGLSVKVVSPQGETKMNGILPFEAQRVIKSEKELSDLLKHLGG